MNAGGFSVWILFFGVFVSWAGLSGCKPRQMPFPQGPEVAVVTLQPERVAITTELPGRTSPYRIAEIRPQVNGLILKRLFTEGSEVQEGEVLYQIDPAPFEAAYERARSHISSLQFRVDRYREGLDDRVVSQQDFDDADALLKQAEAEVKIAGINLDYTRIVSPISGRIGTSSVTEGAIVTAYQPVALATVQQIDPIYVDIPQSVAEMLRFRRRREDGSLEHDEVSQKQVALVLTDGTHYPLEGTLQFKDVTVDPSTGSVILRAIFPNPENVLLPGMFVRAIITEGVDDDAILVPQQGVSRNPKGDPYALIVDEEGKVQPRPLLLDRAIDDKWLVVSGLASGDRVIVEGTQRVRPGAPVRAVPFGSTPKEHPQKKNSAPVQSR
jgi:membrane fusion protein (multidrug efflux system)